MSALLVLYITGVCVAIVTGYGSHGAAPLFQNPMLKRVPINLYPQMSGVMDWSGFQGKAGGYGAYKQQGMMPGMMPGMMHWSGFQGKAGGYGAYKQQGMMPGMMPGMMDWSGFQGKAGGYGAYKQQGMMPGMMDWSGFHGRAGGYGGYKKQGMMPGLMPGMMDWSGFQGKAGGYGGYKKQGMMPRLMPGMMNWSGFQGKAGGYGGYKKQGMMPGMIPGMMDWSGYGGNKQMLSQQPINLHALNLGIGMPAWNSGIGMSAWNSGVGFRGTPQYKPPCTTCPVGPGHSGGQGRVGSFVEMPYWYIANDQTTAGPQPFGLVGKTNAMETKTRRLGGIEYWYYPGKYGWSASTTKKSTVYGWPNIC